MIKTLAQPATLLSIPLCFAASADTALSSASGLSTTQLPSCPRSADLLSIAASIVEGIREDARVIVNATCDPKEVPAPGNASVVVLDATNIALREIGADIPNTAMLGAIARILDEVHTETLRSHVLAKFGEKNAAAFDAGYEQVKI